jgi:glycerol kinase
MLFNINTLEWDDELLNIFKVPKSMLPEVLPSSHIFGHTDPKIFGASLPIGGACGDQQAALFGQCRFNEGESKNTYGTGAFLLMNTGKSPKMTDSGLITTIAWGLNGEVTYALEGSVFVCGAAIQWLRDGLKIIEYAQDSEYYAKKVPDSGGVLVVPAFAGLGAPWWDPYARGTIIGITRATTKYHIIRATLESMAYQTADVIALMEDAIGIKIKELAVDGGASANDLLLSFQADILGVNVERPSCIESTALGAAYLAGLSTGFYSSVDEIKANRKTDKIFESSMTDEERMKKMTKWKKAVQRCLDWED